MKTFKCDFGGGTTCTVQVADDPPPPPSTHIQDVEWTGTPSKRTLRPYIAWMNSVNQQLADLWNLRLMHVFLTGPNKMETWTYVPGDRPRLDDSNQ